MMELFGQKVSDGIALAPIKVLTSREVKVAATYVAEKRVPTELRRLDRAVKAAEKEIRYACHERWRCVSYVLAVAGFGESRRFEVR